jgi:carbamate kinase
MADKKVAVVAVGGNSLIKDKNHQTIPDQFEAASESMGHIVGMIEQGWDVIVTHGNGPQVGFILRRAELSLHELHPVPLDYCGADTAAERKVSEGWVVVEDAGRGWRRVVPSPLPVRIIEAEAIQTLVRNGFVVISVGGGGIPVVEGESGELLGVEAVIDKDFASALLATSLNADLLLISTAVEKVALNFNKPDQEWLDEMSLQQAQEYLEQGHFGKGSMEPKVRAIIGFLERGGKQALITNPENIERALAGETGTRIVS